MTPHYTDDWLTLYGGDCREVLASLPADSVDCVVTSPPYWGLRDYGTATWDGGDAECDHLVGPPASNSNTLNGGKGWTPTAYGVPFKGGCGKCGATRIDSQLGLERTPEEYVANMVAVFREVRRVLKPSGTCWLNLGDSYAGGDLLGRNDVGTTGGLGRQGGNKAGSGNPGPQGRMKRNTGLKPKDLVGIPWRVAFALQADGWYLRSDIIWSKPNPMPESVTDRPTKSHEYLFLLTKSPRYYFDADAVREPHVTASNLRDPGKEAYGTVGRKTPLSPGAREFNHPNGRNIRSVWNIATRPYPGAHFAVFPPELPERCIKAGSSEKGVCPECGAPWERVVERIGGPPPGDHRKREGYDGTRKAAHATGTVDGSALSNEYRKHGFPTYNTTGWQATCGHVSYPQTPSVVLDPFGGSGTVGMVANRLSRRAILIDLNPEYLKQQMTRNAQTPLGLTEGDAA
jgi:DNA modification methylase